MNDFSNEKHIVLLDFYKFVAAILIVFHHYQQVFDISFSGVNFYGGRYYLGYLVELFFMISGFLICYNTKKECNIIETCKKKLLRIYLMSGCACLMTVIIGIMYRIIYGMWQYKELVNMKVFLTSFFLLFEGIPFLNGRGINNPTWYLCVLILCILLFYFCLYLNFKFKIRLFVSAGLIFVFSVIISFGNGLPNFIQGYSNRGYMNFFYGVCLAEFVKHNGSVKKCIVYNVICILIMFYFWDYFAVNYKYILSMIVYPGMILYACNAKCYFTNLISYLGKISFEIYLFHYPLMRCIQLINIPIKSEYNTMFVFTLFTIVFSIVVYEKIEKKLNKYIKLKGVRMKNENGNVGFWN